MKWYDVLPACLVDGVKIVSAVLKGSLLATVDMASASAASAHCDADTFQLVDLRQTLESLDDESCETGCADVMAGKHQ